MSVNAPLVTVVVPSLNQGDFLFEALQSIVNQNIPMELIVQDAGSTDHSVSCIKHFEEHIMSWRSHPDAGQSSAINEGIALGRAPFVCWLNSDDFWLPGALQHLLQALSDHPEAPAAYGAAWHFNQHSKKKKPVWVTPFSESHLALRCMIAQPATLIRRTAWEAVGGLNTQLNMAMDYDLWWRLYRLSGPLCFIKIPLAINRIHADTKTASFRQAHYQEAIHVVKKHHGHVPLKWWLAQPYAVWWRSFLRFIRTS